MEVENLISEIKENLDQMTDRTFDPDVVADNILECIATIRNLEYMRGLNTGYRSGYSDRSNGFYDGSKESFLHME